MKHLVAVFRRNGLAQVRHRLLDSMSRQTLEAIAGNVRTCGGTCLNAYEAPWNSSNGAREPRFQRPRSA